MFQQGNLEVNKLTEIVKVTAFLESLTRLILYPKIKIKIKNNNRSGNGDKLNVPIQ